MTRPTRILTLLAACWAASAAAGPACLQVKDSSQNPAIAKELIDTGTGTVYIAGGSAPLTDAAWADYQPPDAIRKNTTRHLLFDSSCFLRSPSAPADCRGDGCLNEIRLDGHSWVELARAAQRRCLPDAAGCAAAHGRPGNLLATSLRKCQHLTFRGRIFDLTDGTGNRFVMHATGDGNPSADVALPTGWVLERRTLAEPLVVRPASAERCELVLVRDALDQSYHQYDFSGEPLF